MKKVHKILPIILIVCMFFASIPVAHASTGAKIAQTHEIVVNLSNNSHGATITFKKQKDGSFKYVPENQVSSLTSTAEVVVFHVGLKDWTDSQATIYWYAASNLPSITSVYANIYIKSTSILFPTTYYTDTISQYALGGVTYTTDCDYLNYYIPADVTSVRVGWTDLILRTITDTYTGSNSSVVYK